jgi:hypothetical protein
MELPTYLRRLNISEVDAMLKIRTNRRSLIDRSVYCLVIAWFSLILSGGLLAQGGGPSGGGPSDSISNGDSGVYVTDDAGIGRVVITVDGTDVVDVTDSLVGSNRINVSGNGPGQPAEIASDGPDTNVALNLLGKGTGPIELFSDDLLRVGVDEFGIHLYDPLGSNELSIGPVTIDMPSEDSYGPAFVWGDVNLYGDDSTDTIWVQRGGTVSTRWQVKAGYTGAFFGYSTATGTRVYNGLPGLTGRNIDLGGKAGLSFDNGSGDMYLWSQTSVTATLSDTDLILTASCIEMTDSDVSDGNAVSHFTIDDGVITATSGACP